MTPSDRLPAIDVIKAASIVAVLLTHGVPGFFDRPLTPSELAALLLTGFHVPAFLFVAGLSSHADSPVGWRRVADRWRRLLPPYFVVTAVTWLAGLVEFPTPRRFVFKIVTGATFGHFYFVPVLAFCFLCLPVLSRLSTRGLLVLAGAIAIGAEMLWAHPAWRLSDMLFWQVRNPILQFHLGYFVLGVAADRHRRRIARIDRHARPAVLAGSIVGISLFVWLAATTPESVSHPTVRVAYNLTAIAFLASVARPRIVPAAVRFLSDATLTFYLYHWFAYLALMPSLEESLPLVARMLILTGTGLAFSTVVTLVGRWTLGRYSRVLLGV
ncbi:MAG: acyltransferase [Deltaproteobacteria bacterium]|nr:acyltransferase [Deltaproteobacteria bacterium]